MLHYFLFVLQNATQAKNWLKLEILKIIFMTLAEYCAQQWHNIGTTLAQYRKKIGTTLAQHLQTLAQN